MSGAEAFDTRDPFLCRVAAARGVTPEQQAREWYAEVLAGRELRAQGRRRAFRVLDGGPR